MNPNDLSMPLPPLLREAAELGFDELHSRLHNEGFAEIRPGHGCVFRHIAVGGSRLTELAEQSGLTKQAVGEVVDELEQLGYVERAPDPADRRAKIIRLTARGDEAFTTARRIFADIERRWAERIGEERMAVVREVLEQIVLGVPAEEAAA